MPQRIMIVVLLLLSSIALAQTAAAPAPRPRPDATPAGSGTQTGPLGFPLPGGFNPPFGLFDQWWKDPATSSELHLTEAQKKQLDDLALTQRLALIDAGANGMKALTRLRALLDADTMDEPAYKQQLGELSAATERLVQTLGDMAITPRRVLTPEQWKKLVALRAARKPASVPGTAAPGPK